MSPLPPLSALRAFEAVARNLSFSRAAEEAGIDAVYIAPPSAATETLDAVEVTAAFAAEAIREGKSTDERTGKRAG